jgi:hypothetical protein
MEAGNRDSFVLASIEDPEGRAALPESLKLDGIDGIIPGHNDMAVRLGVAMTLGREGEPFFINLLDLRVAMIQQSLAQALLGCARRILW